MMWGKCSGHFHYGTCGCCSSVHYSPICSWNSTLIIMRNL